MPEPASFRPLRRVRVTSRAPTAGALPLDQDGADCHVEGVVETMLDAPRGATTSLSPRKDCSPGTHRCFRRAAAAWARSAWAPGVMTARVPCKSSPVRSDVSASTSRRRQPILNREMKAFVAWFNDDDRGADIDAVLKAGLAHLWFLTVHPFDDGNGRIARAIADLVLARSEHGPQRF
jgi:hypothetical protein